MRIVSNKNFARSFIDLTRLRVYFVYSNEATSDQRATIPAGVLKSREYDLYANEDSSMGHWHLFNVQESR